MFYEIVRIANYHKPYVLLLENVKNILSIQDGKIVKTIKRKLEKIGYQVHYHILNASYYGIPQTRQRVYFVCLRKDQGLHYIPPKTTNKQIFLEEFLEKEAPANLYIKRKDIQIFDDVEKKLSLNPIRIGIVNKGGQGERIYSIQGHAITQSAYGGGVGAKNGLYKTNRGIRRF